MTPAASSAFIRDNTKVLRPPLVPSIALHLADEALALWQKTEDELHRIGLPPPFWAFAWAGGQALARFVLDHPSCVTGLSVLDLASGSGIAAIAAAKAGARAILAADVDPFAVAAIGLNAGLNGVALEVTPADLLAGPPPRVEIILIGDLFYEQPLAARLLAWLKTAKAEGTEVLIGDPYRSYLPRAELQELALYQVPVSRALEDRDIRRTAVFRL